MIEVRRVVAVGAVVSLAAVVACTHVWGDPAPDIGLLNWRQGKGERPGERIDHSFAEEFNLNRFGDRPVVVYQTTDGNSLVAVQLKPDLAPAPALPRDILVLIDTSASKAQGPLASAIKIAEALAGKLGKDDTVALWTLNTRAKSLTRGFQPVNQLTAAFKALNNEIPMGAANLKQGLADAVKSFQDVDDRQRVLVFLGDGNALAGPVDADDRAKLCEEMVARQIAFYAVPLGPRPDPVNIHGFVNGTGGKVVRLRNDAAIDETVGGLVTAIASPILYPDQKKVRLPATVIESMPTKLPPLRRDTPTLLLCKMKPDVRFDYTIAGTVAGKKVEVKTSLAMPKPEVENFFLASMYKQWRASKDRPAMMQADRALAYASDQNQMARADLLAKAGWALDQDRFDPAWRLFKEAQALDPNCNEAKIGLDFVQKFRDGKIDRVQMRKEFEPNGKDQLVRFRGGQVGAVRREAENRPADPLVGRDGPGNILKEAEQRQAIADQQQRRLVDETIGDAQRLVRTQPNEAHNLLKRTLDGVRTNPDIGERSRLALSDRLERSLQQIVRDGAIIARNQAERLSLESFAAGRMRRDKLSQSREDTLRARLQAFHDLMNQGRSQQAYVQAQALRGDLINRGQPIPQAVVASERVALASYHLKELRDLGRLRAERWLSVLLEVDRSHVPFPDEPPVEFPTAAKIRLMTRGQFGDWSDFSKFRTERYSSSAFGPDMPKKALELRDKLSETRKFKDLDDPKMTLQEALDHVMRSFNITIDVNEKAFSSGPDALQEVLKTPILETASIPGFTGTLSMMLKKILARIPNRSGATFIIRREAIEITTGYFAAAEKTIRVYPVADLVIPIASPGQFAQQNLLNQTGILGVAGQLGQIGQLGQLGLAGALGQQFGALGQQFGALGQQFGALGQQFGAIGQQFGAAGQQFGAIGALGQPMGALGAFGQQLGQLGQAAQLGQQGQLGNLGQVGQAGQFGLQNNGQQQLLITLITQVVGKPNDWRPTFNPVTGQPTNPLAVEDPLSEEKNQVGYYPPSLSLVVKGSTHIHSNAQAPQISGAPMSALERAKRNSTVRTDPAGKPIDPKVIWQEALARGVDEPGLIIACADYLALHSEWNHAAEFLKANLRQGILVEPWVYEALALALRESGGTAEEIERAEVSAADLQPRDGRSLLLAAQAMADQKLYDRAVAFCRQAAALQPNLPKPLTEALRYAELAGNAGDMEWAAGNLLAQDWPANNREIQARAAQKVESLVKKLEGVAGAKVSARRLNDAIAAKRRRDLVVKLRWHGEAELDLKVTEPSGSTCWSLNRQSIGGGVLVGGNITDMMENDKSTTYVAAQGFSGEYQLDVYRVWGQPMGDKAQLRIIAHQGTTDESEQIVTVDLRNAKTIKFSLKNGRRTEAAVIAQSSEHEPLDEIVPVASSDRVHQQMRNAAAPECTGFIAGNNRGASLGGTPLDRSGSGKGGNRKDDRILYQSRVSSFVKDSMDMTTQAILSADRRSIRVTVTPVFMAETTREATAPSINNPLLPGEK